MNRKTPRLLSLLLALLITLTNFPMTGLANEVTMGNLLPTSYDPSFYVEFLDFDGNHLDGMTVTEGTPDFTATAANLAAALAEKFGVDAGGITWVPNPDGTDIAKVSANATFTALLNGVVPGSLESIISSDTWAVFDSAGTEVLNSNGYSIDNLTLTYATPYTIKFDAIFELAIKNVIAGVRYTYQMPEALIGRSSYITNFIHHDEVVGSVVLDKNGVLSVMFNEYFVAQAEETDFQSLHFECSQWLNESILEGGELTSPITISINDSEVDVSVATPNVNPGIMKNPAWVTDEVSKKKEIRWTIEIVPAVVTMPDKSEVVVPIATQIEDAFIAEGRSVIVNGTTYTNLNGQTYLDGSFEYWDPDISGWVTLLENTKTKGFTLALAKDTAIPPKVTGFTLLADPSASSVPLQVRYRTEPADSQETLLGHEAGTLPTTKPAHVDTKTLRFGNEAKLFKIIGDTTTHVETKAAQTTVTVDYIGKSGSPKTVTEGGVTYDEIIWTVRVGPNASTVLPLTLPAGSYIKDELPAGVEVLGVYTSLTTTDANRLTKDDSVDGKPYWTEANNVIQIHFPTGTTLTTSLSYYIRVRIKSDAATPAAYRNTAFLHVADCKDEPYAETGIAGAEGITKSVGTFQWANRLMTWTVYISPDSTKYKEGGTAKDLIFRDYLGYNGGGALNNAGASLELASMVVEYLGKTYTLIATDTDYLTINSAALKPYTECNISKLLRDRGNPALAVNAPVDHLVKITVYSKWNPVDISNHTTGTLSVYNVGASGYGDDAAWAYATGTGTLPTTLVSKAYVAPRSAEAKRMFGDLEFDEVVWMIGGTASSTPGPTTYVDTLTGMSASERDGHYYMVLDGAIHRGLDNINAALAKSTGVIQGQLSGKGSGTVTLDLTRFDNGKTFTLYFVAKVDQDTYDGMTGNTLNLRNSVSATVNNYDITITKVASSGAITVLDGYKDLIYNKNGALTWKITINPEKRVLIENPGDGDATLTDALNGHTRLTDVQNMTLVNEQGKAVPFAYTMVDNILTVTFKAAWINKHRLTLTFNAQVVSSSSATTLNNTFELRANNYGESLTSDDYAMSYSASAYLRSGNSITIRKVDALDSSRAVGAKFALYKRVTGSGPEHIETMATAAQTYTFTGLETSADYLLVEVEVPEGYRRPADVMTIDGLENALLVYPRSKTYAHEVQNDPITGEFTVRKVEKANPSQSMGGVGFTLYDAGNKPIGANGSPLASGTHERFTDAGGDLTIANLRPGTYTLRETSTLDGFALEGDRWDIDVALMTGQGAGEAYAYVTVKDSAGKAIISDTAPTFAITNDYNQLVLRKADGLDGTVAGGATFALYQSKGGADYPVTFSVSAAAYTCAEISATAAATGATPLVATGGELTLRKLPVGSYNLYETNAPAGYKPVSATEAACRIHVAAGGVITVTDGILGWTLTDGVLAIKNAPVQCDIVFKKTGTALAADAEGMSGVNFTLKRNGADVELYRMSAGVYRALTTADTRPNANIARTFTTATHGALTLTGLRVGTYTLAESRANLSDVYETSTWTFEVGADSTDLTKGAIASVRKAGDSALIRADANGVYELKNSIAKVSLIIQKAEPDGTWNELLSGAEFSIYAGSGGGVGNIIGAAKPIDGEGKVRFDGLEAGKTYYVRETKLPTYYTYYGTATQPTYKVVVGEDGSLTVDGTQLVAGAGMAYSHVVINTKQPAEFSIQKNDQFGDPVAGAGFALYTDAACAAASRVGSEQLADAQGKITFKDLPWPAIYYLKETTVPANYALSVAGKNVWKVELIDKEHWKFGDVATASQIATQTILNTKAVGTLKVHKTTAGGAGLSGAEFSLFSDSGYQNRVAGPVITQSDGSATFANLPIGVYYLAETKIPSGYAMIGANGWRVEILSATEATIGTNTVKLSDALEVQNQKLGAVHIKKVDAASTGTALSGARFRLVSTALGYDEYTTTGSDGIASFTNLKPGTYALAETKAPTGYELGSKKWTINIDVNGVAMIGGASIDNAGLVVTNTRTTTGGGTAATPAPTGTTEPTAAPSPTPGPLGQFRVKKVGLGSGRLLAGAVFSLAGSGASIQQTSGSDGMLSFTGLRPGTYVLREVSAPDGYVRSESSWTVTVAEDGSVSGSGLFGGTIAVGNRPGVTTTDIADPRVPLNGLNPDDPLNGRAKQALGGYELLDILDEETPLGYGTLGGLPGTGDETQRALMWWLLGLSGAVLLGGGVAYGLKKRKKKK